MLNDIKLHGYLGRDPELSEVEGQNGKYKKATFSLGVSRDYGDETDWFYCVMYGKRAEVLEKFTGKGSQLIVTGRMESYKPKNDPERTHWLVKVNSFDFCDKKTGGSGVTQSAYQELTDDDIPF